MQIPILFCCIRQNYRTVPHNAAAATARTESRFQQLPDETEVERRLDELQKENVDLKIANRAKDLFIAQLKEDRQEMVKERKTLLSQVMHWALGSPEKPPFHLAAPDEPLQAEDTDQPRPSPQHHGGDMQNAAYPREEHEPEGEQPFSL
jgi:hypothetical protein